MKKAIILWIIINVFVLASTAFSAEPNAADEKNREQIVKEMVEMKEKMLKKLLYEAYIAGAMSGRLDTPASIVDKEATYLSNSIIEKHGKVFLDKGYCPYPHK